MPGHRGDGSPVRGSDAILKVRGGPKNTSKMGCVGDNVQGVTSSWGVELANLEGHFEAHESP